MSVRNTILDNLERALNAIKIENGYVMDVATVTRSAFSQDEIDRSKCPAVAIIDDGGETPRGQIENNHRVSAKITLEGFVRHSSGMPSAGDLSRLFNDFLADLRRCIHAADLGPNVLYCRPGEVGVFTGEDRIRFTLDLDLVYYYPEANP